MGRYECDCCFSIIYSRLRHDSCQRDVTALLDIVATEFFVKQKG